MPTIFNKNGFLYKKIKMISPFLEGKIRQMNRVGMNGDRHLVGCGPGKASDDPCAEYLFFVKVLLERDRAAPAILKQHQGSRLPRDGGPGAQLGRHPLIIEGFDTNTYHIRRNRREFCQVTGDLELVRRHRALTKEASRLIPCWAIKAVVAGRPIKMGRHGAFARKLARPIPTLPAPRIKGVIIDGFSLGIATPPEWTLIRRSVVSRRLSSRSP